MNNLNVINLSKKELKEINGGSELTDIFWFAVGWAIGRALRGAETTRAIYASGAIGAPR